jgi:hypothetical protein
MNYINARDVEKAFLLSLDLGDFVAELVQTLDSSLQKRMKKEAYQTSELLKEILSSEKYVLIQQKSLMLREIILL